jgi:hypothetical protein
VPCRYEGRIQVIIAICGDRGIQVIIAVCGDRGIQVIIAVCGCRGIQVIIAVCGDRGKSNSNDSCICALTNADELNLRMLMN